MPASRTADAQKKEKLRGSWMSSSQKKQKKILYRLTIQTSIQSKNITRTQTMQNFLNYQKQNYLKGSIHPRLLMTDLVEPGGSAGGGAAAGSSNKRKVNSLSPKRKTSKKLRGADLVEPAQVGVTKRQAKSLSPRRKTSKQRLRNAPPPATTAVWIDDDDSSQNSKTSTSSRKRHSCKSKTTKRRCASPTVDSSFKLQAMQEEITKLQSIQDHMEKYQASLEKQHRDFQRQLHAMELSHAMAESRTRDLESELEEAVEENERFLYDQERSTHDETKSNLELLQEENQRLRGILERCQSDYLKNSSKC